VLTVASLCVRNRRDGGTEKGIRRTGGHCEERKELHNNINTKFWEELIAYFPLISKLTA
jgi:hypothetical protein